MSRVRVRVRVSASFDASRVRMWVRHPRHDARLIRSVFKVAAQVP